MMQHDARTASRIANEVELMMMVRASPDQIRPYQF